MGFNRYHDEKKLMYVTSSGLKKLVKFNFREHFFGLPLPGIMKIDVSQIKYSKYSRNRDVRDMFRRWPEWVSIKNFWL